jgi:ADP-heptose:LPS heptosyltransferase
MRAGEHASDYFARCLGARATPISIVPRADSARWAAELWHHRALGDSTLIIHAGSGSSTKNWQGMTAIAQRWRTQRRGTVLLLCGPAEESVEVPHDAIVRESSLDRVAALLTRGAGYLGNDSGISHLAGLAGALGTVTFGPSDPKIWHPMGGGLRLCRAKSTTCRQCAPHRFCVHLLTIEEVWKSLSNRPLPAPSQMDRKQE